MFEFFLLFFTATFTCAQDIEINRIGEGSERFFKIDKISPNPMSNPENVFTSFNIPDSANIYLSISSQADEIIVTKEQPLKPGKFQITWNHEKASNITPGKYKLTFKAFKDSVLKYSCVIDFLVL